MLELVGKLYKIGLLSPLGFVRLLSSLGTEGANLMALLRFNARKNPQKFAIVDENEAVNYGDLYLQSKKTANILHSDFGLCAGQKAAFLCRNNIGFVRALFGSARIGARIYLLNPEITAEQFAVLLERHRFDLVLYDADVKHLLTDEKCKSVAVKDLARLPANNLSKIKRAFSGEIIVLTGGTTGVPKTARRKTSVTKFLNPFFALLTQLNLDRYKSVYVATPAYHGFGISAIIIGMILGTEMFFTARFDGEKGCALIAKHQIEVVTVVPLMLQRMLNFDADALSSLECVISGGAAISPTLVEETLERLGDKLYNLYGTSEAGFSVIATPRDLRRSPETIGRKIGGVNLKILDANNQEVERGRIGKICIKSAWSVKDDSDGIETGDVGFEDENGYLYLRGRTDEMIVSGGENVYPIELENILAKHPAVRQIAAVGIADQDFGQRLKAFIVLKPDANTDESEIKKWLATRVARFQMPAAIEFIEELPLTAIGKINKKALK